MTADLPHTEGNDEPRQVAQQRSSRDLLTIMADMDHAVLDPLRLIYFAGLTQDQAAHVLGMSRRAVRRSVAAGMRELAERITDLPP